MKVVLELNIEETVSVDFLQEMAAKAMRAISGDGPRIFPRLLVELGPNYLEIPMPYVQQTKNREAKPLTD